MPDPLTDVFSKVLDGARVVATSSGWWFIPPARGSAMRLTREEAVLLDAVLKGRVNYMSYLIEKDLPDA